MSLESSSTTPEFGRPDATRVAARALVLAAVSGRGMLESDGDKGKAEERRRNMCDWLDHLDVAGEIESSEEATIRAVIGRLDQQSVLDAAWRCEGMHVLAWSLGRAELPRYDQQGGGYDVAAELGFLKERSRTVLASPSLKALPDIFHWTKTYLTIHWRLRQFSISREPIAFAQYVAQCTWGPLTLSEVNLIEGDLAIGDKRIDRISEDQYELMNSVARERHKAFNWLLGFEPVYSEVGTST
jgi:hypothetical protein